MRYALALLIYVAAPGAQAQVLGNGPLQSGGFATQALPAPTSALVPSPAAKAVPKTATKTPLKREVKSPAPIQTGSVEPASPAETPLAPAAKPKPKKKAQPVPVPKERVVAKNDPRPSVHPGSLQMIAEAAVCLRYALDDLEGSVIEDLLHMGGPLSKPAHMLLRKLRQSENRP